MTRFFVGFILVGLTLTVFLPARCEAQGAEGTPQPVSETEQDTTAALIRLLQEKGVLSPGEAERILTRSREGHVAAEQERIIIEKVTENVTERFTEQIEKVRVNLEGMTDKVLERTRLAERNMDRIDKTLQKDVKSKLAGSSWARRIQWGGDIRLRYQGDTFDESNSNQIFKPSDPTTRMNTTVDRHRGRIRVRLAAKATILDDREDNVGKLEAGVRLATGNESDPVSTNDTLGDYQNKDNLVLDRAYLKWSFKPEYPILGRIPYVSITGGRIPNPWFSTDLVWDGDLNFEGGALQFKTDTLDSNRWYAFLTLGAFPVQEVELVQDDKWLYGAQVGFSAKPRYDIDTKFALAYYDYKNIEGQVNALTLSTLKDYTMPLFQQKGNTLIDINPGAGYKMALASDYDVVNLTAKLDLGFFNPTHIVLTADYARNMAFDEAKIRQRTGANVPEENQAYALDLSVGNAVIGIYGDWRLSLTYKHIEADAVLDAFTDSDFHLGGTNAEGWVLGAQYGLYKNTWVSGKWISSDQIEGPAFGVDTLQIDLNTRF